MEKDLDIKDHLDRLRAAQGPRRSSDVLSDRQGDIPQGGGDDSDFPGGPDTAPAALRDVEAEAEMQALRQEADMLRNAVRDKDNALEALSVQCRSLEDALEDRDRELDRLHQELAPARPGPSLAAGDGTDRLRRDTDVTPISDGEAVQGTAEQQDVDVLDGTSLVFEAPKKQAERPWLPAALGGLVIGAVVAAGAMLFFSGGKAPPTDSWRAVHPVAPSSTPPLASQEGGRPVSTNREAALPGTAVVERAASPQPDVERDLLRDGSPGPTLVRLGGGRFVMGATRGVVAVDEQPAHEVNLSPFYLGVHEVTFDDYDRFARAAGRPLPDDAGWGRGQRPVINVSWDDAQAYTRWLSRQTGNHYRLPSESEWEFAARGGVSNRYWWGFAPEAGRAICFDCGSDWDNRGTAPVGSMPANPYGLHETAGNVMEWVQDCVNPDYRGAPPDGSVWESGDCAQRMIRGGAFNKPVRSLRSSARFHLPLDSRLNILGFRVARDP